MTRASKVDLELGKKYERVAAEVFAQHLWPGAIVVENPGRSHIDHCVIKDNKMCAYLEVKKRRTAADAYPTTIVHFEKHTAGRWGKKFFQLRTYCLIVFTDRVGVFFLDENPDGKELVKRWDRKGEGIEHATYNLERFKWYDELLPLIEAAVGENQ